MRTIDGIVGTSNVTFSYTPPRIGNITSPPFNGGTMQILGTDFVDQGIAINIYEDGCVRHVQIFNLFLIPNYNANTTVLARKVKPIRNWLRYLSMDKQAMVCTYATTLTEVT